MLKNKMFLVRKSPRTYLDKHCELYLNQQTSFSTDDLLCLLSSAAHYEFDDLFHQVDETLLNQGLVNKDCEFDFYYYMAHGQFNRSLGLESEAMAHLTKAYSLAIQTEDLTLISRSLIYMSSIFDMSGDRETAISYAKRALQNIPNLKDDVTIAELYLNYGVLLNHANRQLEAIDAFILSISYFKKMPDYHSYLNYCVSLHNLGKAYLAIKDRQKGKAYLNESLLISEKYNFLTYFVNSIQNLSDFYLSENEPVKANKVLSIFVQQQRAYAKNKVKIVSERHKKDFIPHLDSLQALYEENTHLNKEIQVIKSTLKNISYIEERDESKILSIAEGLRKKEFVPFLQSKWSIKDQKVTGAELLARWQQGPGEIKGPQFFIELIENTDFIVTLTEQLVHQTLEAIAPYIQEKNPDFKLAINVSPYQLAHHDLKQFIELCCVSYGVKTKNFEIEIVERTFIENNPKAIDQLFELSKMGVLIALDDFGSGYSSLACVVSLPVDVIKIDRSLIKNIHNDPRSERLFRSIIAMVKELNIKTIAEGIETAEHLLIIQQTDCDEGQGYFTDRPAPIAHCHWMKK